MSISPDLDLLGLSELKSLLIDLNLIRGTAASTEEQVDLHHQIFQVRRELLARREGLDMTAASGPDFGESGGAGVRQPRRPPPQTDSDGIALPEPASTARFLAQPREIWDWCVGKDAPSGRSFSCCW
jgi:hypothetical protein